MIQDKWRLYDSTVLTTELPRHLLTFLVLKGLDFFRSIFLRQSNFLLFALCLTTAFWSEAPHTALQYVELRSKKQL